MTGKKRKVGRIRETRPAAGPWAGMARRRTGLARARASLRRLTG